MNWKRQRLGISALVVLGSIILACSDEESGSNSVDVLVFNDSIDIPASLEQGYTTFQIRGESDGDNHLLFVRGNDGVTTEAMKAGIHANDGSGDALVTIVGGNGGMPKGAEADVTFELSRGIYAVVLFDEEGELAADSYFSVGDGVTRHRLPLPMEWSRWDQASSSHSRMTSMVAGHSSSRIRMTRRTRRPSFASRVARPWTICPVGSRRFPGISAV